MIAIIDYGIGNLFSLRCSLAALGQEVAFTSDRARIDAADRVILPGVGAFGDAAEKLRSSGMAEVLRSQAASGKPILGICLGMQLLLDRSYEYGVHAGLGLIHGEVRPISEVIPAGLKIPHMGWNSLDIVKDSPLFKYLRGGEYVYFVHSFHAAGCGDAVAAVTEYGAPLTAVIGDGNVMGCQFHPEKSGGIGLSILRAFCETEF